MGTPSAEYWTNVADLPDFKTSFPRWKKQSLQKFAPGISDEGLDLL